MVFGWISLINFMDDFFWLKIVSIMSVRKHMGGSTQLGNTTVFVFLVWAQNCPAALLQFCPP